MAVTAALWTAAGSGLAAPAGKADTPPDTDTTRLVHRIEAEYTTGGILHTNGYLTGENAEGRVMNHASALALKYAFMPPQGSLQAAIYRGAYQGVGVSAGRFNHLLGNPVSAFVFQGARIFTPARRLSLNYEWNLGLTFGWKPYDAETNPDNRIIGSNVTAYIAAGLYLCYRVTPWLDINAGINAAHYSNGNTSYPNAGLNTLGASLSAACYVGRRLPEPARRTLPSFRRHVSYDITVFGAWRRRGADAMGDGTIYALPGTYAVAGLNFNPMYNINHWLNAGVSLDAVYDRSANLYFESGHISAANLRRPPARRQMAAGLSARAEFVMPYFTINLGVGKNVIGAHGDFSNIYQILALKVNVYKGSFLHIGYCLDGFKNPNYLMLGIGYRLNGKRKW